jgi:hypothetical protein
MRPVTVAVQVAPSAAPLTSAAIEANTARALALVEAWVAATGAARITAIRRADMICRPSALLRFSVPQPFDRLADTNLALRRRHADALLGDAATPFPYGATNAG